MLLENSKLLDPALSIILVLVLIGLGVFLFFILKQAPKVAQIIAVICILFAFFALSYGIRASLTLQVSPKGVTFSYPPFTDGQTSYLWANIKEIKVIKFDAEKEFGGWGERHSKKFGNGYLSKGDLGLFITDNKNARVTITILDSLKAEKMIRLYFTDNKKDHQRDSQGNISLN
ncbi:hypothetical protein BDD43_1458 [Mucilaginibacter gracilis]|uniref:PH (Pleckstrin Homology) domain-containing protein n=1 Tax=Mucilaginibacter gracilis TaxID=423350 RepID=A0A495IXU2_9SPHI|nr:hypothetical protein [Mucilaginibacter gracilis]RKR81313.1 hypothetical protein BDD43_1458 [Mucilaginibacter gracilis]